MTTTFTLSGKELADAVVLWLQTQGHLAGDMEAVVELHAAKRHSTAQYHFSATVRIEPRS